MCTLYRVCGFWLLFLFSRSKNIRLGEVCLFVCFILFVNANAGSIIFMHWCVVYSSSLFRFLVMFLCVCKFKMFTCSKWTIFLLLQFIKTSHGEWGSQRIQRKDAEHGNFSIKVFDGCIDYIVKIVPNAKHSSCIWSTRKMHQISLLFVYFHLILSLMMHDTWEW